MVRALLAMVRGAGRRDAVLRFTYDVWRRRLNRLVPDMRRRRVRILDSGCGPGYLLGFLESWFPAADLTGLDIDPEQIRQAESRTRGVKFVCHSAEELPFDDNSFHVVFAMHVLEHLHCPGKLIREAKRVLRPGGIFIAATPNPESIAARIMKSKWKGFYDDHVHLAPPPAWRASLEDAGFTIICDGTTGLSGLPALRRLPLALLNWVPLFFCGFFPWSLGEAYVAVSRA